MISEIRNELLCILALLQDDKDKDFKANMLLERFEYDIKRQLEDLECKKNELKNNLELLNYVKEELKKTN